MHQFLCPGSLVVLHAQQSWGHLPPLILSQCSSMFNENMMRTCGYTPFLAFLRRFYYLCYSPVDFRATLLSGFFGYSHWEVLPLRMWMNFDRRSWMRQRVTHWNSEISHHCGFYQRSTGWFFRRTWMGSWLLFVLESDSQWYTVHIYIIIYNHIYII